jgi:hypothetical protein
MLIKDIIIEKESDMMPKKIFPTRKKISFLTIKKVISTNFFTATTSISTKKFFDILGVAHRPTYYLRVFFVSR